MSSETSTAPAVAATPAAASTPAAPTSSSPSMADIAAAAAAGRLLNLNVGILGHVDSGKTSLAKALSTLLSTASLDKLPQSQARGITLDLGFSAFCLPVPERLKGRYDLLQVTLVDCPGHASLIRTIIGGASLLDLMLLVLDVTRGIQTQTAECLVLGEILSERMIVVLNKTDLLRGDSAKLDKIVRGLRKQVFAHTKFGADVPMVPVAANPGSKDDLKIKEGGTTATTPATSASVAEVEPPRVQALVDALSVALEQSLPRRLLSLDCGAGAAASASPSSSTAAAAAVAPPPTAAASPFLLAVDHCFQIRGQGTVLTGTILQGRVRVGDTVEIPSLGETRKVKSIQRFRTGVEEAGQGDRVGVCVTQLDSKLLERGLVCAPGSLGTYDAVVAVVDKVRFFKGTCATKSKFHVSIGHATAMATAHFFGGPMHLSAAAASSSAAAAAASSSSAAASSDGAAAAPAPSGSASSAPPVAASSGVAPPGLRFDFDREYAWRDELLHTSAEVAPHTQYAVLEFEKPIQAPLDSVLLGSRLDADVHTPSCRIAFSGRLLCPIPWREAADRARLKVVKPKVREGVIDRVVDSYTLIGRDLFGRDTDMAPYAGKEVELAAPHAGVKGRIEGSFGQGGKFRATFPGGLPIPQGAEDSGAGAGAGGPKRGKKGAGGAPVLKGKILLRFKKYMYALDKKAIVQ